MIKSCDVGSLPLFGDTKKFLEGAALFGLSPADDSVKYFEKRVIEGFLDKVGAGVDVPNYPQFRDMNEMFLAMIDGVEKVEGGYMETKILSIKAERSHIPEVEAIKRNSREIYKNTGEPFKVKICVTGPYTLSSLFVHRDNEIFKRLGHVVSRIVENNVFSGKQGNVTLVAVDEPVFGFLDDPLIDHSSEGRKHLRNAWESVFHKARSKDVQTCMHLHNTADELFWEVKSLNIIESHVDDPVYQMKKTRELLESTDKFLKASVCVADFDRLIRERVIATSREKMSKSIVDQRIAEAWANVTSGKLDPKVFLENVELMKERLVKIVKGFGVERVPYAGPECGLWGFPTYDCALECLRRVSRAVKSVIE